MYGGQISPEMYQLAISFQLGKPTARFETLPRIVWHFRFSLSTLYTAVLVIWLGLFALLSYLLEFSRNMADIPSNYALVFVIFWSVIWMIAIWCIIGYDIHMVYQHICLYLCTSGLPGYNEYNRSVTAIPWDTIESVRLVISPIYIAPDEDEKNERRGLKLDSWEYTFQCSDGKRVVFKGQSGIRIRQQTVAWKNILYVDMKLDQIKIRLPDMEYWIGIDKASIPTMCVLEELVHQIIG